MAQHSAARDLAAKQAKHEAADVPLAVALPIASLESPSRLAVWLRRLSPFLIVGLLALAAWIISREAKHYSYHDIARELDALPAEALLLAMLLTIASYGLLTFYDFLGLAYIGRRMSYARLAFASFIGYVFSYNIGLSVLGGGAVRYRLYSGWGLSTPEIARLIGFAGITFWLGCLTLGGVALVFEPSPWPADFGGDILSSHALGAVFLAIPCAYAAWALVWRRALRLRTLAVHPPARRIVTAQFALATADCALAATVLYVLLPHAEGLTYAKLVAAYLIAIVAGLVSHVPGGLGVFETVLLFLLGRYLTPAEILGALLAYRVIYYVLPFVLGAALLGTYELGARTQTFGALLRVAGRIVPEVAPRVLSVTTFVGGLILLTSGATPAVHGRLHWLQDFIPLPLMELSHFVASLIGASLLILSRGLQRRLDGAYHLTLIMLAVGIVMSLIKGADYEEAIALMVMLAALAPTRRHFYRHAPLLQQRLSAGFIAAIVAAIGGSVWMGFFAYKHVEYSSDLWWHFALYGDAPRFLRASVGASAVAIAFGVLRLLRPSPTAAPAPSPADLDHAFRVVQEVESSASHLALLGDKHLMFSAAQSGLLMYAVEGRSWVALGDPLGSEADRVELAWRFREVSDRYGGWTVFYEVGPDNVTLYLDLGLTLVKLGEEGRVPLADFALDGPERRELRNVMRRCEKDDLGFRVLPAADVPARLDELAAISDAWLDAKSTREKGFSLGFFERSYLSRLPVAVVEQRGKLIAFANLWPGGGHEELSVDLMRHSAEAPRVTMDFLFTSLMLYGREQGYAWFNLGMAPFSGLESRTAAPLWQRLGAALFQHGEHFYNFQGLRHYKEKYNPVWRPRYLASPGVMVLPLVVANIAALVSRGLKGVVSR